MLVARRDPFHPGAHDAASSQGADVAGRAAPRLARTVNMLQVVGSLLAIPVGLASGYSIYRANFSVETTCQSLRANIVSMIDKSVDAGTRRMLVRRDVESFEQTCGAIDPDATAAFKALLAADKPAAPIAAPVARRVEAPPKELVRKADPPPQATAKLPAAPPAAAAAEPVRRDPAVSDAQWLDAVRQALVAHGAEPPAAEVAKAPVAPAAVPAQRSAPARGCLAATSAGSRRAGSGHCAGCAGVTACGLGRNAGRAASRRRSPGAAGERSPNPLTPTDAAKPDEQDHPRIRRWIAKIPLMGNVIE